MNTSAYERAPSPAVRRTVRAKKKYSFSDLDRRRQKKLFAWYELMRGLGNDYNLSQISEKHGFSRGRASQILYGHDPLTPEWMLIWAIELGASPFDIWEEDWPFPQSTPYTTHALSTLVHRWKDFSVEKRDAIAKLFRTG